MEGGPCLFHQPLSRQAIREAVPCSLCSVPTIQGWGKDLLLTETQLMNVLGRPELGRSVLSVQGPTSPFSLPAPRRPATAQHPPHSLPGPGLSSPPSCSNSKRSQIRHSARSEGLPSPDSQASRLLPGPSSSPHVNPAQIQDSGSSSEH